MWLISTLIFYSKLLLKKTNQNLVPINTIFVFLCAAFSPNNNYQKKNVQKNTQRYYNREAVVISALQVEKHPLTTPGPFSTPPPPGRHNMTQMGVNSLITMTPPLGRFDAASRTGSPIPRPGSCASGSYGSPRVGEGFRSSPKPHSSPKMKLRWCFINFSLSLSLFCSMSLFWFC